MRKTVAIVDIRLWLYKQYHRKDNLLSVFNNLVWASPLTKFSKVVFVWDNGKNQYHKKLYPEYKEHRTALREKLSDSEKQRYEQFGIQYNKLLDICKLLCTNISIDGTEADTFIEVLSDKYASLGYETYIFSDDSDFMVLLNKDNIYQVTSKGEVLQYKDVIAKKGVTPSRLLDSFCLAGQAKDNIKGIKNLGEIKDINTGKIFKAISKECETTQELIDNIQYKVDSGFRKFALPENYPAYKPVTTVQELYDFNYQLNKPYTYDDLIPVHREELVEQVNTRPVFDEGEFTLLCWENFSTGVVITKDIKNFFNI